jgi:uncharacterized protein YkwD
MASPPEKQQTPHLERGPTVNIRRNIALATATLMATTGMAAMTALVAPSAAQAAYTYTVNSTEANTSYALVDKERTARSIRKIYRSTTLDTLALNQSKRMASKRSLYHNPNFATEMKAAGFCLGAENVGYGASASQVHTAFMGSSAHKANILNSKYVNVGVGVTVDSRGVRWVTQVFGTRC